MLRLIFLLIQARLQALTLTDGTTKLFNEVDRFTNQYDLREPDKQMLAVPACYIQFTDSQFEGAGAGAQYLPQIIRLHIVTLAGSNLQRYNTGPSGPPAHDQILDLAYIGIQGHRAKASDLPALASLANTPQDFEVFNACTRKAIYPDYDGGHIIVTILDFKTLAFDPAAIKHYTKVMAQLNAVHDSSI